MKNKNNILKGIIWIVVGIIGLGLTVSFGNLAFLWFTSLIIVYYGIYKIYIWAPSILLFATVVYRIVLYDPGDIQSKLSLGYFSLLFVIFLVYAILAQKKIIKF